MANELDCCVFTNGDRVLCSDCPLPAQVASLREELAAKTSALEQIANMSGRGVEFWTDRPNIRAAATAALRAGEGMGNG